MVLGNLIPAQGIVDLCLYPFLVNKEQAQGIYQCAEIVRRYPPCSLQHFRSKIAECIYSSLYILNGIG